MDSRKPGPRARCTSIAAPMVSRARASSSGFGSVLMLTQSHCLKQTMVSFESVRYRRSGAQASPDCRTPDPVFFPTLYLVRIVGTGARAPTDVGHQDHERPRARADNPDKVERGPGIRSWRHRGLAVFPARPAIGPRAPRDALGALGPWRFKHFSARRRRRSPRDLWGYLSSRPPPRADARGRSNIFP